MVGCPALVPILPERTYEHVIRTHPEEISPYSQSSYRPLSPPPVRCVRYCPLWGNMADPDERRTMLAGSDQMQRTASEQEHNLTTPSHYQPNHMTPDEVQIQTIWDEIVHPRRTFNSCQVYTNAAASQYQSLLDPEKYLYSENNKLSGDNKNMRSENKDFRATTSTLSGLGVEPKQSQASRDVSERCQIELQRRLDNKDMDLETSVAMVQNLTAQKEVLEAKVKSLESSAEDARRLEQSRSKRMTRNEEKSAKLKEEVAKLKDEVAKLKEEDKKALDAMGSLQDENDAIKKEKLQLQEALEEAEHGHLEDLAEIKKNHGKTVDQLETKHQHEVKDIRSGHNDHVAKLRTTHDKSYDKLRQDNKAATESLRTAQEEIQTLKIKVSNLSAHVDTKHSDLRKLGQELDSAKTNVAKEKNDAEEAQRHVSSMRDSAARSLRSCQEIETASESHAERLSKQGADLDLLHMELKTSREALATAESKSKTLAADKARAEEQLNDSRIRVSILETQSVEDLSKTVEARHKAEELRSQLQEQEAVAAGQSKKAAEMSADAGQWRLFEVFEAFRMAKVGGRSQGVSRQAAPSPRPGDNLERPQSVSRGGAPSMTTSPSNPVYAVMPSSKKRPAGSPASDCTRAAKTPRSARKGGK